MKKNGQTLLCIVLTIALVGVLGAGIYKSNKEDQNIAKMKQDYEKSISVAVKPEESVINEEAKKDESTNVVKFDLKDKNILSLGDGVSKDGIYQGKVKALTGMASITNLANNGLLLGNMVDNINAEVLKAIDLVMIMGGTNDFTGNKTLGTIADTEGANTFYGDVQAVINKIKAVKPQVEIVFLTPLKHGKVENQPSYPEANNTGSKLDDYVKAIIAVCEKNSVKSIDLFNESGIESSNMAQYTTNNIMLNESGHEKVAQVINIKLKELYPQ